MLEEMQIEYAHRMGFECGRDGVTLENCHFTLFSAPNLTAVWENGKRDGEKQKALSI